jgi:transposase
MRNIGDRATLERLVADGKTPQKIVARARIVLLSGCGLGTNAIQREARVSKPTVWRWQKAYMDGGVERLLKDRGKGARAGKKPISAEVRLEIVTRTAKEKPKHATHWSARMLAEEIGVGHTTVQRVWKEHGLKPHLSRPFKLSNDPKFVADNLGPAPAWPTIVKLVRRRFILDHDIHSRSLRGSFCSKRLTNTGGYDNPREAFFLWNERFQGSRFAAIAWMRQRYGPRQ